MADYAIGDVQGCFDPLQRLLEHIDFNENADRLWFVGDLINRGPQSLAVLRFVHDLPLKPHITLGNHDLYLLNRLFIDPTLKNNDDTIQDILSAPDGECLGHWLRQQPLLIHDTQLNCVMTHAGIAPLWSLTQAKQYAQELQHVLQSEHFIDFLQHMFGNEPRGWHDQLEGMERLRVICNYFTRMRFCDDEGFLYSTYKGSVAGAPAHLHPWYATPHRIDIPCDIIFGHWAALQGQCPHPHIYALDTGCVWGGHLTALRLQDRKLFQVEGLRC